MHITLIDTGGLRHQLQYLGLAGYSGAQRSMVVEGQLRGIFDPSALKAIERYRYKPTVINGEGVSAEGIRQRIVFELRS